VPKGLAQKESGKLAFHSVFMYTHYYIYSFKRSCR